MSDKPTAPEWLSVIIEIADSDDDGGRPRWSYAQLIRIVDAVLERDREERQFVADAISTALDGRPKQSRPWADELDAVSFAEWFDKESGGVFHGSLDNHQFSTLYRMFYQAYEGKAPE